MIGLPIPIPNSWQEHNHDLAFGILQVETIAKLIRGVDFDSVTRNLLEKAYAGVH